MACINPNIVSPKELARRKKVSELVSRRNREDNPSKRPGVRMKISEAHKGKTISLKTRMKMSETRRGMSNPAKRFDVRQRISKAMKGRPHPWQVGKNNPSKRPEVQAKISEAQKGRPRPWTTGEKNGLWKGGISFEPYCPLFNEEFKERVRAFFRYRCIRCGKPQSGNILRNGRIQKLHVHHVNFNKMTCCDGTPPLFASLCIKCHSWTNHHRDEAEATFIEVIEIQYGGRCYLYKEETPPICIYNSERLIEWGHGV